MSILGKKRLFLVIDKLKEYSGTKLIEQEGLLKLKSNFEKKFRGESCRWWDRNELSKFGVDAIVSVGEVTYFIELKSSRRHPYRDNLRMTPSTIRRCYKNGVLNKLIIALVTDSANPKTEFVQYIPFGKIPSSEFFIDVTFGFKPHRQEGIVFDSPLDALKVSDELNGIETHLNCTLAEKLLN